MPVLPRHLLKGLSKIQFGNYLHTEVLLQQHKNTQTVHKSGAGLISSWGRKQIASIMQQDMNVHITTLCTQI